MNRHHYFVAVRVSAPSDANLDEEFVAADVEYQLTMRRLPFRIDEVTAKVTGTDIPEPEPEEPSLSAEDRNPGLAAAGE